MRPETLKGHLDGMLLAALEPAPRHGYAIMEALRAGSGGQFDLPTGTVYPALHRLERAGLIKAAWSEAGGGGASTS
jgi:DNA-binding PadR family transcriptional regulator